MDSIPGKLDDMGGSEADSGSGQIMAFINEPTGRICSWGIPLAESYGHDFLLITPARCRSRCC